MRARTLVATLAVCAVAALISAAPSPAIVGGSQAAAGTFPSLAFISDDLGGGQMAYCTGTVVSSTVVLTAGHCLEADSGAAEPASGFTVDTGTLDPSEAPAQSSVASAVAVYPTFDPYLDTDDAGVLVLATPTTAPAVTLAGSAEAAALNSPFPIVIAGWGLTSATATAEPPSAQTADMTTQTGFYCSQNADYFDETDELCAPGANAVAVCNGDSGGPAFATLSGTTVEVGIIDRADDCDPSKPSVFTRVDAVSAWVQSEIAANPPPAPVPAPSAGSTTTTPAPATDTPAPTTSLAPPSPPSGAYVGDSAQRRGRVQLTASGGAITRVRLAFNIRCGGVWLGPITSTRTWAAGAPKLAAKRTGWSFEASYRAGRYQFALSGTLPARGSASGTLSVRGPHPNCASGAVSWRAVASG